MSATEISPIPNCSPPPPLFADKVSEEDWQAAVMADKLWPIGMKLTYAYLDGADSIDAQVVDSTIKTWEKFGNFSFVKTNDTKSAHLRITFRNENPKVKKSWSYVGTDNLSISPNQPTMTLGWLTNENPPTDYNRGTILHEFGHALGMNHEHQSPARAERLHLIENEAYQYYGGGFNKGDVKSQVLDLTQIAELSNWSHLDLKSIMMYHMSKTVNQEGIEIPANTVLSELDKAFITLNYPRTDDDAVKLGGMKVSDAIKLADVNADTSAVILSKLSQGDLEGVRAVFKKYNKELMKLTATGQDEE